MHSIQTLTKWKRVTTKFIMHAQLICALRLFILTLALSYYVVIAIELDDDDKEKCRCASINTLHILVI